MQQDSTLSTSYKQAFTLVELLVVISVIALLSSIVFAGLASARDKANAAYTAQTVRQYEAALEMFASDNNGTYPFITDVTGNHYCFGQVLSGTTCYGSTTNVSTDGEDYLDLRTYLQPYIPSLPPVVRTAASGISGARYSSCGADNTCEYFKIRWLQKDSDVCFFGEKVGTTTTHSICEYKK